MTNPLSLRLLPAVFGTVFIRNYYIQLILANISWFVSYWLQPEPSQQLRFQKVYRGYPIIGLKNDEFEAV